MIYRLIALLSLFVCLGSNIKAENYLREDSLLFEKYVKKFSAKKTENIDNLVIQTALYFLNRPYVASTLEINETENLVVNLREFDCTTFVENCIALSKTIQSEDRSFKNFRTILQSIRYREGKIEGYTSRLHYTSDWITDNEKKGVLKNISQEIGGTILDKKINFMSGHPQSYKHLKESPENVVKMKDIENAITENKKYALVLKSNLNKAMPRIKNGDIVVFGTSIDGLDYSHIGIAYYAKGKLTFIHASSKYKKTCVEPKGLNLYCKDSSKCNGVSVLRLNN